MLLKLNRIALGACLLSNIFAASGTEPQAAANLYRLTNIWDVHLKISPDQWEAIEPKGSSGPPRAFGPSMFLAPVFMRDADADENGKITQAEFAGLATKWFTQWDKDGDARINTQHLRDGLNDLLAPPQGQAPFRMSLQGAEGKRNGVASMAGFEFEYGKADLDFNDQHLTNVALRYKGNGTFLASRGTEKRSFKVDLNDFVKGQKLAGLNKLNLHNCVTDASWMNEVLSHRLFRDGGVPAPRTAYARVKVTVPGKYDGQYFGLYSLVENVDEDFAKANFGSKKGGIFKPVTPDLFGYKGEDWARYNQTYDPKGDVTVEQKQRIIELCKLVSQGTDDQFNSRIAEFIDLDEFSRYMAVLVFLADLDGLLGSGQNYYLHMHPTTRKIAFIPWDLDHSFGQFGLRGTQEQREKLSIEKPWQGEIKFLARMFQNPEFVRLYRARLAEFSQSIFAPSRFEQQVDELAAILRPAVAAEAEDKLERFDSVVAGKSVEPGSFGRGPGGPRMPFMQMSKPIKPFVKIRAQSISDQLAGKSAGETLGDFGFGPPGRGGQPPRGFGPGMFLTGALMPRLDADKDGWIARDEAKASFAKLFDSWKSNQSADLTEEQLRAGIDRDLVPPMGPFGGPGGNRPPSPPQ